MEPCWNNEKKRRFLALVECVYVIRECEVLHASAVL
jgi:hypothetical protein